MNPAGGQQIASQSFSPARREASIRGKTPGSFSRWRRASGSLAGGVSSGLRRSAHPYPLYFAQGRGARLYDVDGNCYLDYSLGWGPNLLGNAPAEVVEAVREALGRGFTFGAQHELEYEVAEMLTRVIPCADRVCFANSGTEIVQVALRLARAVTGRRKFIKFEGHYHGWDDSVLQSYHPSAEQLLESGSAPIAVGLGQAPADQTVIAQWNDTESVHAAFAREPGQIAALMREPGFSTNIAEDEFLGDRIDRTLSGNKQKIARANHLRICPFGRRSIFDTDRFHFTHFCLLPHGKLRQ